jgi:signal transduction histidine kinase
MLTEEELNTRFKQLYLRFSKRSGDSLNDVNELLDLTHALPAPWYSKAKIAEAHFYLTVKNDYIHTLELCRSISTLITQQKAEELLPTLYSIQASCYQHLGELDKAEEHYLKGITAFQQLTEPQQSDYHRLGSNYFNLLQLHAISTIDKQQFDAYMSKSIQAMEKAESATGLSNCYNLLAKNAFDAKDYDTALELMLKSFVILEQEEASPHAAIFCNNISRIYSIKGNRDASDQWYQRGLALIEKSDSAYHLGVFMHQRMEVLMEQTRMNEAIETGIKAEQILLKIESIPELFSLYRDLALCYAAIADYKTAYTYQQQQLQLNEQLFTKRKAAAIAKAQQSFQWQQKEKENLLLLQKAREIEIYARQLEIKNEDLKHFAHAMSHDLKEPLRTINSMLTLLERSMDTSIKKEQQEYLDFVHDAVSRLSELVESVLGFSNLTGAIQKMEIDLNRILEHTESNLKALIQERNVSIESNHLPSVFGDETHLTQLFQNLITNAVKYNDSEVPKVKITYERKGDKHVLSIADNGIGIPSRYHQKVFELFQRLHSKDKYSGSGIGLAVCKKIMQQMDGDIYISNNPSGGTIFHLEFPTEQYKQ